MKTKIISLMLSLFAAHGSTLFADQWGFAYEREYLSPNHEHMLRILPDPARPIRSGHCTATLFKIDGKNKTEVWSRHLINHYSPVRAFVSDSGQYVITMDEWAGVGKRPVVIYNSRGALIKVHSTDSLGLAEDWEKIKVSTLSYHWNENAISFYGPEEETFFIRLHWGKLLLIRLRDGALMEGMGEKVYKTQPKPKIKTPIKDACLRPKSESEG